MRGEAMMRVVGVAIAAIAQPAVAIAATTVDVRRTIAAAAERDAAAPKTSAMERSTAASKTAAVEGRAATAKTATTAAAETTAAMATVTAAYFDRHCFGCVFGCRHRARTCQRQRFSALLRCGRQNKHGGSRQSRTADNAPRGT